MLFECSEKNFVAHELFLSGQVLLRLIDVHFKIRFA